jgi:hypothetical protein
MSATFTSSNGGDPVAQFRLAAAEARYTRADLLYGGNLILGVIRDRTFAGTDVDGAAFEPYSPEYAKRKAGSVGAGVVNLFGADHHTHMLNALQVLVDSDVSFGIGIYSNDELESRARVHNEGLEIRTRLGTGNGKRKPKKGGKASFMMPRRQFLGASPTEIADANEAMVERVNERLKRLQ